MPAPTWRAGEIMSVGRMNAASLHQAPGDEVQNMAVYLKTPGMKVFITADSTDLTLKQNKTYTLSNDLSTWMEDGLSTHKHISSDDGGALSETLAANVETTINLDKRWAKSTSFYTSTANNGTVTDDATDARIVLNSSTTSSGRASIYDGGARKLNFAKSSTFESTLKMSSDTNFKVKVGINAENIQDANNTAVPSYGIEGCSSSGTVWLVWSCTGTNRSTLTTASPIVTTNPAVYNIEHLTGNSITLSIDGVALTPKTTDPPATGLAALNNIYKAGVQNSAAESKILWHYGGPQVVGGT